jgi:enoyl-CoA hydratase/carnithine racemase
MSNEICRWHVDTGVALVTLDRPPVNALRARDYQEIIATIDEIATREDARVVILTGAGRVFCAGRDVKAGTKEPPEARQRAAREAFASLHECPLPVIGAINGPALGAGFAIASVCDMLIASDQATFGLPEIDAGVLGGYKFIARVLPEMKARRMFFTCERIGAAEAYRLGLVDRVVSVAELLPEARKLAQVIAAKSGTAVRLGKKSMIQSEALSLKDGYRIEQMFTVELMKSKDSQEAAAAFLERRAPRFRE